MTERCAPLVVNKRVDTGYGVGGSFLTFGMNHALPVQWLYTMTNAEIGHRILVIRTYRSMDREPVAHAAGMSYNKLWKIETGKQGVHHDDLRKLAEVLHFSLDEFGRTGAKGFDLTACLLPVAS